MESILLSTPFYKTSTKSHSFPTRPSRLATRPLTRPFISFSSNSRRISISASASASASGGEEKPDSPVGAIVLDVRGMACEGCVTSVKSILESQPQVSSASVDLAKATAIIWPAVEAKVTQDWQTTLGENLAKHLTSCGFESNLQRVT